MIHKIVVENFFSIADSQEIILEIPNSTPDLPCFKPAQPNGSRRLPVVVGFFGANASGKTTILRTVVSLVNFLLYSFDNERIINLSFQAYRRSDWLDKPTKIMIEFDSRLSDNESPAIFRYELHIVNKDEYGNKAVSYEALSYSPKGKFRCIFERDYQVFHFGKEFGISTNDPRKKSVRHNASVISTLKKLNHLQSKYLCDLLETTQTNFLVFDKISPDSSRLLQDYVRDKDCFDQLSRELQRFDVGIESMSITPDTRGSPIAVFKHIGLNADILFNEESSGTKRFIETFPALYYGLKYGTIVIIDEIDNDIHPLLLPEIIRWFSDPKRNLSDAQLFFTAHNPAILDCLEKEQIFFVEKPSGCPSHLYGAGSIKGLRREPSIMRKYLLGELGAVPHVG
jgi:AAA15 family ATPase/GTPase